jgi:hypothetical protein
MPQTMAKRKILTNCDFCGRDISVTPSGGKYGNLCRRCIGRGQQMPSEQLGRKQLPAYLYSGTPKEETDEDDWFDDVE